ncbi:MAG: hypothetical protein WBK77_07125 [Alphaproteobacteria bacterium]
MKLSAKNICKKSSSSASIVDGKLILSCPEASTPVVWQMDLSQAKASALEVRENEKGGYILHLKTLKGENVDVANFSAKEEAVDALMATARALENAQGHIRPASSNANTASAPESHTASRPEKKGKWGTMLLGAILILILMGIWGALAPRPPGGMSGNQGSASAPAGKTFGANTDEPGVPLSADEFLMKRQK